jgi:hypothetical protein
MCRYQSERFNKSHFRPGNVDLPGMLFQGIAKTGKGASNIAFMDGGKIDLI